MLKTIIAIAALALVTPAFADDQDTTEPAPAAQAADPTESAPAPQAADPAGSPEDVLGACLEGQAHMTWIKDVHEYEKVRFSTPNQFYFGSRLWVSSGSDVQSGAFKDCLRRAGAHPHR